MDETQFSRLLAACQVSAVHLEMRDQYMISGDPDLDAWNTGYRPDLADRSTWWHPWLQNIVDATTRGVAIRRARIVSEPISDYIHYEYDGTFANIAVGEQIRWLPRRQATDLALPGNDFWLFDGRILLVNHFAGNGDWGGEQRLDDPDTIKLCSEAFEAVWARATPHEQYQPRLA